MPLGSSVAADVLSGLLLEESLQRAAASDDGGALALFPACSKDEAEAGFGLVTRAHGLQSDRRVMSDLRKSVARALETDPGLACVLGGGGEGAAGGVDGPAAVVERLLRAGGGLGGLSPGAGAGAGVPGDGTDAALLDAPVGASPPPAGERPALGKRPRGAGGEGGGAAEARPAKAARRGAGPAAGEGGRGGGDGPDWLPSARSAVGWLESAGERARAWAAGGDARAREEARESCLGAAGAGARATVELLQGALGRAGRGGLSGADVRRLAREHGVPTRRAWDALELLRAHGLARKMRGYAAVRWAAPECSQSMVAAPGGEGGGGAQYAPWVGESGDVREGVLRAVARKALSASLTRPGAPLWSVAEAVGLVGPMAAADAVALLARAGALRVRRARGGEAGGMPPLLRAVAREAGDGGDGGDGEETGRLHVLPAVWDAGGVEEGLRRAVALARGGE